MADETIILYQGVSDTRVLTVTIPDPADANARLPIRLDQAVDDTADRPTILRSTIKLKQKGVANADGLVFKTSYDVTEIDVLDQTVAGNEGKAIQRIDEPDTDEGKVSTAYILEVRITRQDIVRTGALAGSLTLVLDSPNVVGVGTSFLKAKPGDVFTVIGGANDKLASRIVSITDNLNMVTERADWTAQAVGAAAFDIRRGDNQVGAVCAVEIRQKGVE